MGELLKTHTMLSREKKVGESEKEGRRKAKDEEMEVSEQEKFSWHNAPVGQFC